MDYSVGYPVGGSRQPHPDSEETEAWRYVRRVARRRGGQTRVHPRVVLDRQPTAKAILSYAKTHDADLIALATRGRGGLARLLRGSVTDQVVRGASVPVLVLRPDAEQERSATP
jgi:nucleotide-binding universal stress UspA family protein